MREIEFRGYSKRIERWLYGFLIADNTIREFGIKGKGHEVLHIGQYTGLKDKNGTKIFEGDIIKINEQYTRVVRYSEVKASFVTCDENQWIGYLKDYDEHPIRVIGNIYDNPELLKN